MLNPIYLGLGLGWGQGHAEYGAELGLVEILDYFKSWMFRALAELELGPHWD